MLSTESLGRNAFRRPACGPSPEGRDYISSASELKASSHGANAFPIVLKPPAGSQRDNARSEPCGWFRSLRSRPNRRFVQGRCKNSRMRRDTSLTRLKKIDAAHQVRTVAPRPCARPKPASVGQNPTRSEISCGADDDHRDHSDRGRSVARQLENCSHNLCSFCGIRLRLHYRYHATISLATSGVPSSHANRFGGSLRRLASQSVFSKQSPSRARTRQHRHTRLCPFGLGRIVPQCISAVHAASDMNYGSL